MLLGITPTQTDTTALFRLGVEADDPRAADFPGNRIKYVRADSAIALGDAVVIQTAETDEPFAVIPTSAVDQAVEGIAHVAIASGSHGWITTKGNVAVAKLNTGVAAGAMLVSGGTAGTLFAVSTADATDASNQGRTIKAIDAESGGTGQVYIS